MKKNNKKNIRVAVILFVAIILVVIYLMYMLIDRNNYDTTEHEDFIKYYTAETVLPRNISELYAYQGVNETNDMFMSMNSFVSYISELQNKFKNENAEELKKFFSENDKTIKSKLSISNEKEFINLINYINQYDVDKEKFSYAEIVPNSSFRKGNYYWVEVRFFYGDNNPIVFNVGLATKANNKVIVKYEFDKFVDVKENNLQNTVVENKIENIIENTIDTKTEDKIENISTQNQVN